MNTCRRLILAICLLSCLPMQADTEPRDTVCFYETWEQMFDMAPVAMAVDPYMYFGPYEMEFVTSDDKFNNDIHNSYLAATINDSIWFINSEYLRKHFKSSDAASLSNYLPLFFDYKVAYAIGAANPSVAELLFGSDGNIEIDYYYIDFVNRKVRRVNSSTLSQLLEDYHDLQMRYEGMKDYKKREIIEDYFFKYIDRASQDVMHPYILDLFE